jgi:hypothetical protein
MMMIAAIYMDTIARGGRVLSCPCGRGEGWAIVVVGVMGPLDGDACVTGPTTETAAWGGSRASFTLANDLPPHQDTRQCTQQSSQSGSLPLDSFYAFTTF